MKKEVTIVPKDKCPLDILAEMGDRTKNAWIFLHENAVEKLEKTCNQYKEFAGQCSLLWHGTKEFPLTNIHIDKAEHGCWKSVNYISADDIAFSSRVSDPEEIFFLKMDE